MRLSARLSSKTKGARARLSNQMQKPNQERPMHRYRSHNCAALRNSDVGSTVRLSGWVHRVRDHGGVLFIDLRDHYGVTQVVADPDSAAFNLAETVRSEWVIRIDGDVKARSEDTDQSKPADRRCGGLRARDRSAFRGQGTADAGVRRAGLPGGRSAEIPLSGSAARDAAPQHHAAHGDHRRHASVDGRGGFHRIFHADPDGLVAGRRAGLPGAEPASTRASSMPCRRHRSSTSS